MGMLESIVEDYSSVKSMERVHKVTEKELVSIIRKFIEDDPEHTFTNSVLNKIAVIAGGIQMPIDIVNDDGEFRYRLSAIIDTSVIADSESMSKLNIKLDRYTKLNDHMAGSGDSMILELPVPKSECNGWNGIFSKVVSSITEMTNSDTELNGDVPDEVYDELDDGDYVEE